MHIGIQQMITQLEEFLLQEADFWLRTLAWINLVGKHFVAKIVDEALFDFVCMFLSDK